MFGNLKKKLIACLVIISMVVTFVPAVEDKEVQAADVMVYGMQVNHMTNPLGTDETPVFSWKLKSDQRAVSQSAYQIKVTQADGSTVWDSGKVESGISVDISYEGTKLEQQTRYDWSVRVWDMDGNQYMSSEEAYFETGIGGDEGFRDADWIRLPDTYDGPMYKYSIEYVFEIEKLAFGPVFGAQDGQNYYMWQIVSDEYKQLKPHIYKNGTPSSDIVSNIQVENGTKYAMLISVNGREVTTYLTPYNGGEYSFYEDSIIDIRDLETSPEMGALGFQTWAGNESFYIYKILARDEKGQNIPEYDIDFSLMEDQSYAGGEIADGRFHAGDNLNLLKEPPVKEESVKYTLDYEFSMDGAAFSPVFGATDSQNFYMWQINHKYSQVKPHIWSENNVNGDVNTSYGVETKKDTKYNLRIVVGEETIKTYLKEHSDEEYTENDLKNTTKLSDGTPDMGILGFRVWDGGDDADQLESFYVYKIKATDNHQNELYNADFTLSDAENPFEGGKIENGGLHISAEAGKTDIFLDKKSVEQQMADKYTIDYVFSIDGAAFNAIFGAKDAYNNNYKWQVNQKYSQIKPHINGTCDFNNVTGVEIEKNKKYVMRIAVGKNRIRTFIKEYEEDITFSDSDIKNSITVGSAPDIEELGFSVWDGGGDPDEADAFSVYSVVAKNQDNEILYQWDFSKDENPFDGGEIKDGALYLSGADGNQTILPNISLKSDNEYGVKRPEGISTNPNSPYEFTSGETPRFRKEFETQKTVKSARLYSTAAGIYDVFINGTKVSYDYFNPGNSEYKKTLYYQTFDVTDMIKSNGANAIAVEMGTGWYAGAEFQYITKYYGRVLSFIGKLVITYDDETKDVIVTDDSWECTTDGPLKYQNLIQGETYDARDEQEGWSEAGYVPSSHDTWEPAATTNKKKLNVGTITSQNMPTIRAEKKELTPKSVVQSPEDTDIPNGKKAFIYDFGQNFAGNAKITLHNVPAGTQIRIRHGEMLSEGTDRGGDGPAGTLHTANYADTEAVILYTAKGVDGETYTASKFHTGFRYIEITGIDNPEQIEVKGVVIHTDMDTTSTFDSSNKNVNQLYSNTTWSQRSNFIAAPTDCPQRSERLGWAGDIGIFARTSTFNMNDEAFLEKWVKDAVDCQRPDGAFADIAPRGVDFYFSAGTGGWNEAPVIVAYELYHQFGNKSILEKYYDNFKKNMECVYSYKVEEGDTYSWGDKKGQLRDDIGLCDRTSVGTFGDWVGLEKCEIQLTDTAYAVYEAKMMVEIANVLGKTEDAATYQKYIDEFTEGFRNYYLVKDEKGNLTGEIRDDRLRQGYDGDTSVNKSNSQTAYVLGIYFDLIPEDLQSQAGEYLVADIQAHDNHLTTGFLGVPFLTRALDKVGRSDVSYILLEQETYPGWLSPIVDGGATTIWELWNSYTSKDGISTSGMNSFNHYSYGSICAWLYQKALGIQRDDEKTGYKHFTLAPTIGGTFEYMEGSFESAYGRISSRWSIDQETGNWTYEVEVPANTTATVVLPDVTDKMYIEESGRNIESASVEGITDVKRDGVTVTCEVGSGTYKFYAKDVGSETETTTSEMQEETTTEEFTTEGTQTETTTAADMTTKSPVQTTTKAPAATTNKKVAKSVKKPGRVKALKKKKRMLTWRKVKKADGYQIRYAKKKKGKYRVLRTTKKVRVKFTAIRKLKKGKAYFIKVRAYRKVRGKKFYGPYSKTVRVKR